MLFLLAKLVPVYAFLVCKIFGTKLRSCKIFDKFQVCPPDMKELGPETPQKSFYLLFVNPSTLVNSCLELVDIGEYSSQPYFHPP